MCTNKINELTKSQCTTPYDAYETDMNENGTLAARYDGDQHIEHRSSILRLVFVCQSVQRMLRLTASPPVSVTGEGNQYVCYQRLYVIARYCIIVYRARGCKYSEETIPMSPLSIRWVPTLIHETHCVRPIELQSSLDLASTQSCLCTGSTRLRRGLNGLNGITFSLTAPSYRAYRELFSRQFDVYCMCAVFRLLGAVRRNIAHANSM